MSTIVSKMTGVLGKNAMVNDPFLYIDSLILFADVIDDDSGIYLLFTLSLLLNRTYDLLAFAQLLWFIDFSETFF